MKFDHHLTPLFSPTHLTIAAALRMERTDTRSWMAILVSLSLFLALVGSSFAQSTSSAASTDESISNGTCYYANSKIADSTYIPCGNVALNQNYTCCETKSICLGHNACYSFDGTTYLAGCTDSSYSDAVCPDKGPYGEQQWTGLVYCNGTSDEWTLCDDSSGNSNTVLGPGPACWCPTDPASRLVAFNAPVSLIPVALLPSTIGSSISYYDGFGPDSAVTTAFVTPSTNSMISTAAASPTSTSNLASAASTSVSSTMTSAPQSSQASSGLSAGAKAGIGVGAAAGGIITFALLWLLALCIKRRRQKNNALEDAQIRPRSQALAVDKGLSENQDPRSPTWSGNKSELPSDERTSASFVSPESIQGPWGNRPTSAEVEGTIPTYQSMGSLRSRALGDDAAVYQPYRRAAVPPVGVQEVSRTNGESESTYRLRRQTGGGVYEMPAQVPGSTLR